MRNPFMVGSKRRKIETKASKPSRSPAALSARPRSHKASHTSQSRISHKFSEISHNFTGKLQNLSDKAIKPLEVRKRKERGRRGATSSSSSDSLKYEGDRLFEIMRHWNLQVSASTYKTADGRWDNVNMRNMMISMWTCLNEREEKRQTQHDQMSNEREESYGILRKLANVAEEKRALVISPEVPEGLVSVLTKGPPSRSARDIILLSSTTKSLSVFKSAKNFTAKFTKTPDKYLRSTGGTYGCIYLETESSIQKAGLDIMNVIFEKSLIDPAGCAMGVTFGLDKTTDHTQQHLRLSHLITRLAITTGYEAIVHPKVTRNPFRLATTTFFFIAEYGKLSNYLSRFNSSSNSLDDSASCDDKDAYLDSGGYGDLLDLTNVDEDDNSSSENEVIRLL